MTNFTDASLFFCVLDEREKEEKERCEREACLTSLFNDVLFVICSSGCALFSDGSHEIRKGRVEGGRDGCPTNNIDLRSRANEPPQSLGGGETMQPNVISPTLGCLGCYIRLLKAN